MLLPAAALAHPLRLAQERRRPLGGGDRRNLRPDRQHALRRLRPGPRHAVGDGPVAPVPHLGVARLGVLQQQVRHDRERLPLRPGVGDPRDADLPRPRPLGRGREVLLAAAPPLGGGRRAPAPAAAAAAEADGADLVALPQRELEPVLDLGGLVPLDRLAVDRRAVGRQVDEVQPAVLVVHEGAVQPRDGRVLDDDVGGPAVPPQHHPRLAPHVVRLLLLPEARHPQRRRHRRLRRPRRRLERRHEAHGHEAPASRGCRRELPGSRSAAAPGVGGVGRGGGRSGLEGAGETGPRGRPEVQKGSPLPRGQARAAGRRGLRGRQGGCSPRPT